MDKKSYKDKTRSVMDDHSAQNLRPPLRHYTEMVLNRKSRTKPGYWHFKHANLSFRALLEAQVFGNCTLTSNAQSCCEIRLYLEITAIENQNVLPLLRSVTHRKPGRNVREDRCTCFRCWQQIASAVCCFVFQTQSSTMSLKDSRSQVLCEAVRSVILTCNWNKSYCVQT